MTKRILVAAGLLASTCVAHAGVLPVSDAAPQAAQSAFLDKWTDATGKDITSSSIFGEGARLVGGVSHGHASAAKALFDKASAGANGAITIKRAQGIEGTYVVATNNYKLAILAGNGVSATTDSDGNLVITKGNPGSANIGGGFPEWVDTGAGSPGAAGPGADANNGVGDGVGGGQTGNRGNELVDNLLNNGNSGNAANGSTGSTGNTGGAGGNAGLPVADALDPAAVGEVPEPSSIALMLAGMAGAMSMLRRRKR